MELTRLNEQPAAPSFKPTPIVPTSLPPNPASLPVDIAAKQAEIRAKLAAMKAKLPGLAGPPGAAGSASPSPAPPPPTSSRPNLPPVPGLPKPNLDPELARKIAEAKRKVEEMAARNQAAKTKVNPYLVSSLELVLPCSMEHSLTTRSHLATVVC